MGWLLRQGVVLASLDVTGHSGHSDHADESQSAVVGAELRPGARVAVGLSMKGARDLAWLDADLVVREIAHVGALSVKLRPRACSMVLLAERGAFDRWRLATGDQLEVRA